MLPEITLPRAGHPSSERGLDPAEVGKSIPITVLRTLTEITLLCAERPKPQKTGSAWMHLETLYRSLSLGERDGLGRIDAEALPGQIGMGRRAEIGEGKGRLAAMGSWPAGSTGPMRRCASGRRDSGQATTHRGAGNTETAPFRTRVNPRACGVPFSVSPAIRCEVAASAVRASRCCWINLSMFVSIRSSRTSIVLIEPSTRASPSAILAVADARRGPDARSLHAGVSIVAKTLCALRLYHTEAPVSSPPPHLHA